MPLVRKNEGIGDRYVSAQSSAMVPEASWPLLFPWARMRPPALTEVWADHILAWERTKLGPGGLFLLFGLAWFSRACSLHCSMAVHCSSNQDAGVVCIGTGTEQPLWPVQTCLEAGVVVGCGHASCNRRCPLFLQQCQAHIHTKCCSCTCMPHVTCNPISTSVTKRSRFVRSTSCVACAGGLPKRSLNRASGRTFAGG